MSEHFDRELKFTLDNERVLNLLTGEAFYGSVDAALREAILNAIDACIRRRASEADAAAGIRVAFDRSQLTIVVDDDGDGMSGSDMTELFMKVAASA